jgi:hypothetical protein
MLAVRPAERSRARRIRSALWFLVELPLALISFGLYVSIRALMRRAVRAHFAKRPELASSWRVVSKELLEKPIARIAAVATAPRWNTHAIVGSAGPLTVRSSIAVSLVALRRSAEAWAMVVHAHPSQRPLLSFADSAGAEWAELSVEPGSYMLMSRYYHLGDDPELPEVRVDGQPVVRTQRVSKDANAFYRELEQRVGPIALVLHFHVVTLLRIARWLPSGLLARHMVPVGAPNTRFSYGVLERGERLRLRVSGELRATHEVFYDLYGRDSIPYAWGELETNELSTEVAPRTGFYLVRVQARSNDSERAPDDRGLEISVIERQE